ncbi:hypothetical protein B9Z55_008478 [Caenorhabditis nigoni]|nr:hypothetical protein B9Z55_008478 [Caenorhabditis nigoni]
MNLRRNRQPKKIEDSENDLAKKMFPIRRPKMPKMEQSFEEESTELTMMSKKDKRGNITRNGKDDVMVNTKKSENDTRREMPQEEEELDSSHEGSSEAGAQRSAFSITKHLNGTVQYDPSEQLRAHIEAGDVEAVGRDVSNGVLSRILSDVQLREIAQSVASPQIPISSFVHMVHGSNMEQLKNIVVGQQFLSQMNSDVSNSLTRFEASLNSVTSNFNKKYLLGPKEKGILTTSHISPAVNQFRSLNLNMFYTSKNFTGDKAVNQMTNIFSSILRMILPHEYSIWVYSYRPTCLKNSDRNFKPLPSCIVQALRNFGIDALGCYLPISLLCGEIDMGNEFVASLGENAIEEIEYRRNARGQVENIVNSGINFALQNLRNYHYDMELEQLVYCGERKKCSRHFRWDDEKAFRQRRRDMGLEVDDYRVKDVMRMARRSSSTTTDQLDDIEPYPTTSNFF